MNTTTKFITFISFTFLAVSASASIPDFVTPGNNISKQIIDGQRTKFTEIGNGEHQASLAYEALVQMCLLFVETRILLWKVLSSNG